VRRLRPQDLEVTDEERELARTAAGAGGQGAAWGGGLGTALGAGLGAALSIPTMGVLSPGLVTAGAGVGGALGGAIGSSVGGMQAEGAEKRLAEIDEERQRRLSEYQLRQQALDDLLAQG
jgi:hypothetical protein